MWMPQIAAFVLVASVTMVSLIVTLPLGEGNDEVNHVVRVASLLDGQLLGERRLGFVDVDRKEYLESGFVVSGTYLDAMLVRERDAEGRPVPIARQETAEREALHWGGAPRFAEASNTALYPPVLYLPAILGIATGQMLQQSPVAAIRFGRLFNALFYLVVGGVAWVTATRGRLIILTLLLTPMSLSLAASINQDGPIIALAALACAMLGQPPDRARSEARHWIGVVCLALIVTVKPPYMPLAGLLWITARRWPTWQWRDLLALGLVVILPFLWAGLAAHAAAVPFGMPPYYAGPYWTGPADTVLRTTDPAAQVAALLADPSRLLTLPLRTFIAEWDVIVREVVGVLSWRDFPLPAWLYWPWYAAILAALGLGILLPATRRAGARAGTLVGVCLVGSVYAIYWALYVSWTAAGYDVVSGVQGRYFIPVLSFVPLALPWRSPREMRMENLAMVVPIALAALGCVVLPSAIVARYYLP